MYYESIKASLEEEFKYNNLDDELKFKAFDLLNKLSDNFDKLANCKPNIISASLAFFVLSQEGKTRNFKQMEDDFGVDAKKLALKVKEISPFLGLENADELVKQGLFLNQREPKTVSKTKIADTAVIPESIVKAKKKSNNHLEIHDEDLIVIIKKLRDFAYFLYKDKEYIEIKQFVKLLELNLFMGGYNTSNVDTEKRFGDLFIHLDFEPKKGREQDKFVNLKDRFGNFEPFSLIKLGE